MSERYTLNGNDWQFKGYIGEDWRWRGAHRPGTRDTRGWLTGSVPGSVHRDLWQAGEIPNPYVGRNSLLCEWVPARTWLYKKAFFANEAYRGKTVRLCFEGIDYEAQFFLNGELLGQHRGMFTPAVFDVTHHLLYGEGNLLAVVLEPAPHEQPQVGRTSRVWTHKTRMNYWWDFCPRLVHVGIWDDAYLAVSGPVWLEDVAVRPRLAPDNGQADVSVAIELAATEAQLVAVETAVYDDEGHLVAGERSPHLVGPGRTHIHVTFDIMQPKLWWPNGHGARPLYEAGVRVGARQPQAIMPSPGEDHTPLPRPYDQRRVPFGIRRIELVDNETTDPAARPYTLVVNGRKLYINGWNWVPLDVLYGGEQPARLARLLTLAQKAHVNLLRVWGGGLIEKEAFYQWCDRLGLLVWQEFIQSSSGIDNIPPSDPDYIAMLTREAVQIVRRKRNHPSLAIWCGGNELQGGPEQPLDDTHPTLAALRAVVQTHDPDRLWLPTSPTGRFFSNSLENIAADPTGLHDVHGPWEHQGVVEQFTLYNQGTSLLHSEFGVEGITNLAALNSVIPPDQQWPISLDNALWQHLGAWWVKEKAWREAFGEWPDVATAVRATQFLQADGLRYAVEANRRRQYQNSGSLPWQFNEPYPMAACTSAVDYYARPKPAYYTVARAYAPVHVSAQFSRQAWAEESEFTADIWVANAHETPFHEAVLTTRLLDMTGVCHAAQSEAVSFAANVSTFLARFNCSLAAVKSDLFFLDLHLVEADNTVLAHNRYLFSHTADLAPLLSAPETTVAAKAERAGDTWRVTLTNTGEQVALWLWLVDGRDVTAGGYLYLDDNYFCLLPQESRTLIVTWQDVSAKAQQLVIEGWNFAPVTLPPPSRQGM